MKKKTKIAVISVVGIAALMGWFLFHQAPKSELAILGDYKGPLRASSRETLLTKPLIDIPWFGRKRWRFPEPERNASDYLDILRDRAYAGVLDVSLADQAEVRQPAWRIDKQTFGAWIWVKSNGIAIPVPYVFGPSSKVAKFRPNPESAWLSVRLPANGIPAPEIATTLGEVGGVKIRFAPRQIVSPAARLVFDVSVVSDHPSDLHAVRVGGQLCNLLKGRGSIPFPLYSWNSETPIVVSICKVTAQSTLLKVARKDSGNNHQISILSPKGEVVLRSEFSPGSASYGPPPYSTSTFLQADPNKQTLLGGGAHSWYCCLVERRIFDIPEKFLLTLKDGQMLRGVLYKPGVITEGQVKLSLPNPALFHQE